MIGGFALVAWPAEYGCCRIQTFMVNHDGVVYENDLGSETVRVAAEMTELILTLLEENRRRFCKMT